MDFLAKEALMVLMLGSTHYVDTGRDGDAILYYADESTAYMTLPSGKTLTGAWHFTDDGYFVDWAEGPEGEWRIAFEPGRFAYLDGEGTEQGDITQIVPGNPEGFGR